MGIKQGMATFFGLALIIIILGGGVYIVAATLQDMFEEGAIKLPLFQHEKNYE